MVPMARRGGILLWPSQGWDWSQIVDEFDILLKNVQNKCVSGPKTRNISWCKEILETYCFPFKNRLKYSDTGTVWLSLSQRQPAGAGKHLHWMTGLVILSIGSIWTNAARHCVVTPVDILNLTGVTQPKTSLWGDKDETKHMQQRLLDCFHTMQATYSSCSIGELSASLKVSCTEELLERLRWGKFRTLSLHVSWSECQTKDDNW